MIDYIVDANVLISMLISGRSSYHTIAKYYYFYTPSFALTEMDKYQDTIFLKSKLQPEELRGYAYRLFSHITSYLPIFVSLHPHLSQGAGQVFGRVYADAFVGGDAYFDRVAVFQPAQLF